MIFGLADGSQPKKRGPKPDSKPALTRRQELNRQAQRSVNLIVWKKEGKVSNQVQIYAHKRTEPIENARSSISRL